MVSIVKYGQEIDLSKIVAVNGKKSLTLDNLVLNNTIKIKIPAGIKYLSELVEDDLKITFKDEEGNILELILKDMSTLLAQNDGFTLVELTEILADGKENIIAITDLASASQASAAGPGETNANSDSGSTPDALGDLLSAQNDINNATIDNAGLARGPVDATPPSNAITIQNHAPIIDLIATQVTDEDNSITIPFNASDVENDLLTYTVSATNGTAVIDGNGDILFTPDADFNGNAVVTINANDGSTTTSQSFDVTVNPVNDAPIATPDTGAVDENASVTIDVLNNDIDIDAGAILTLTNVTSTKGNVSIDSNNKLVFEATAADFDHLKEGASEDIIVTYTMSDEFGETSTSTATITVTGVNDRPEISNVNANGSGTTIVDFEGQSGALSNTYGGINWDGNVNVLSGTSSLNTGYFNGTTSGDYVAYNSYAANPITLEFNEVVTFNSTNLTSAWFTTQDVIFEGYLNGVLVNTSSVIEINYYNPTLIDLNWSGIDKLVIYNTPTGTDVTTDNGSGSHWAMDDFTYTGSNGSTIILENDQNTVTTFTGSLATVTDLDTTPILDTHTYSLYDDGINPIGNISVDNTNISLSDFTVIVTNTGNYTVEGNFEALSKGEEATVTFNYVATDNSGALNATSIAKTVTVTITGTNDLPIVKEAVQINIDEFQLDDIALGTNTDDTTLTIPGSDVDYGLKNFITDVDASDTHKFFIAGPVSATIIAPTSGLISSIEYNPDQQLEYIKDVIVRFVSIPEVSSAFGINATTINTLLATASTTDQVEAAINAFTSTTGLTISFNDTEGLKLVIADASALINVAIGEDDGGYSVSSALFNHLGVQNVMSVGFDYNTVDSAGGTVTNSVNVDIKGSADTPTVLSAIEINVNENDSILIDEKTLKVELGDANDLNNFVKDVDITDDFGFYRTKDTNNNDTLSITIKNNSANLLDVLNNQSDMEQVSYIKNVLLGLVTIPEVSVAFGIDAIAINTLLAGVTTVSEIETIINTLSSSTGLTMSLSSTSGLELQIADASEWETKGLIDVQLPDNNGSYIVTSELFDHLGLDNTMSVTFGYFAIDSGNEKVESTVTINVAGSNDGPVITSSENKTAIEQDDLTSGSLEFFNNIETTVNGTVNLSFSTSNSLIVKLFEDYDIDTRLESSIIDTIKSLIENGTNSVITIDVENINGTINLSAKIEGLDSNPFASLASQENLNTVLLQHLGDTYNISTDLENAVYNGTIEIEDVDNMEDVSVALGDVSLTVTSTNKLLIAVYEKAIELSQDTPLNTSSLDLDYIKTLLTDLVNEGIPTTTTTSESIEIPSSAVQLLEAAGLLNVQLGDFVSSGITGVQNYQIVSPLFNMMKESDSVKVSFDYTVTDTIATTAQTTETVTITGSNDAPVAIEKTYETEIGKGSTSYDGALPGAYLINMAKDVFSSAKDINNIDDIISQITADVKSSVNLNPTFTTAEVNTIKADLADKILTQIKPDLSEKLQSTIEASLGTLTGPSLVAFQAALDTFASSGFSDADINILKASLLSPTVYGVTIANLSSDIQTVAINTANQAVLAITVQSFNDTFAPSTFDQNSLSLLLAAKAAGTLSDIDFATQLAGIVTPTPLTPFEQAIFANNIDSAKTDAISDILAAQSVIDASVVDAVLLSIKGNLPLAITAADETILEAVISTYVDTQSSTNLGNLMTAIETIYIANPLNADKSALIADIFALNAALSPSAIIDGIDQDALLQTVLTKLNLTNIDASILNDVIASSTSEIKSFIDSLNIRTLANDEDAISNTFKDLLDSLFTVLNDTIDDIISVDDAGLAAIIKDAVEVELNASLQTEINKVTGLTVIQSDTLTKIVDEVSPSLAQEVSDKISISIADVKASALESIFELLGLPKGLLTEGASRDEIAEAMVQDIYDRINMDEDIADLATLKYLTAGNIQTVVTDEFGATQTLSSATEVNINQDGSYTITNDAFATINTLWNVKVTFDYVVSDGQATSAEKSITVDMEFSDSSVSDGSIAGARVFEDLNDNKMYDEGERFTYTNEDGDFFLTPGDSPLVAIGGTDISSGLAFEGILTAPAGSTVLSPLTSLIQSLIESGKTEVEASALVKSSLGISDDIDLKTYDAYALANETTGSEKEEALAVQKIAVKLVNIINEAQDVAGEDASQNPIESLSSIIAAGTAVDLSSEETITAVLTGVGASQEDISSTTSKITTINTAMDTAGSVEDLAKIQIIAKSGTDVESKLANLDAVVVNKVPTLKDIVANATLDEDSQTVITFTAADEESDVTTNASANKGSVSILGNEITYIPNENFNGTDLITVVVTDEDGANITKTVALTINSINDLPTLEVIQEFTINEDNSKEITFATSDVEGETTTSASSLNGSISILGNVITYIPNENFFGIDTITVVTKDSDNATVTKTITVTIDAVDDLPTLEVVSTASVLEDGSKNIVFTASDVDGEITVEASSDNATVVIIGNEISYTPNENFNGLDTITVTVYGENNTEVTKTIEVTVDSVNDLPILSVINELTINEDVASEITFEVSDSEGSVLVEAEALNGTVEIINNKIFYTPTSNYFGSDTITVTGTDTNGAEIVKTISVTIESVNDLPSIHVVSSASVDENGIKTINIGLEDVESSNDTIDLSATALNGTAIVTAGVLTYTPNENYSGFDTVTVKAVDEDGGMTEEVITINVSANEAPVVVVQETLTLDEDTSKVITFTATDAEGDVVTMVTADNGSISIDGNQFQYTPNGNFNGTDYIRLNVTDTNGEIVTKVITVTVNSLNDLPTLDVVSTVTINEDTSKTIAFTAFDVEGIDEVTVSVDFGTVEVNGNVVTYTPIPNFYGEATISIIAKDSDGETISKEVAVTVDSVNDIPVVSDMMTNLTDEESASSYTGNLPGSELTSLVNKDTSIDQLELLNSYEEDLLEELEFHPNLEGIDSQTILQGTMTALGITEDEAIASLPNLVEPLYAEFLAGIAFNATNPSQIEQFNYLNATLTNIDTSIFGVLGVDSSSTNYVSNTTIFNDAITAKLLDVTLKTTVQGILANSVYSDDEKEVAIKALIAQEFAPIIDEAITNFDLNKSDILAQNLPTELTDSVNALLLAVSQISSSEIISGDITGIIGLPSSVIPSDDVFASTKIAIANLLSSLTPETFNLSELTASIKLILDASILELSNSVDSGITMTQTELSNSINNAIALEITNILSSELASYKAELEVFGPVDETAFAQFTAGMINSVVGNDDVLKVEDVKELLIGHIIDESGFDYHLIQDETRAEYAQTLAESLAYRATVDVEGDDFVYMLNPLVPVIASYIDENGDEVSLEDTEVTVNLDGTYTVSNDLFDTEAKDLDIKVTFEYMVSDEHQGVSESKSVTLEIDRVDTFTAEDDNEVDMSTLLSSAIAGELDTINLIEGDHILNNFTLEEFVALSDDDNIIKVLGDTNDTIKLSPDQNWTTNNVADVDGFVTYSTNSADETLKLLIEENVNVEI